jgi:hypothetical protein
LSDALNIPLAFVVIAVVMLVLLLLFSQSSIAIELGRYLERFATVIKGFVDWTLSLLEGLHLRSITEAKQNGKEKMALS